VKKTLDAVIDIKEAAVKMPLEEAALVAGT
jgi:hypothetical protein